MSTAKIERVFGRGRVRMATGDHVEVFREAAAPGERRRYTKRFLETGGADFRQWTHREWRILARLIGHGVHCVPDVVQYHGDAEGGVRQLQTYDAGVTVDQWATVLPVTRNGAVHRNVFEDCAHWWALAHHSLAALDEIHALHVVHLDFKADNVCIPLNPPEFDPESADGRLYVDFDHLALIDFAFSLVSRNSLTTPLPIGWEKDYDYQSPRLLCALEAGRAGDLAPTQELDWRCDLYSLAAMLRRYLCDERAAAGGEQGGWTSRRRADARALIYRLRGCHDSEFAQDQPHRQLMELTAEHVRAPDLAQSLADGWNLDRDSVARAASWITPMTRIVAAPVSPTSLTLVHGSPPAEPIAASTFTLDSANMTASAAVADTITPMLESSDTLRPAPAFTARTMAESSEDARPTVALNTTPAVIRRVRPSRGSARTQDRSIPEAKHRPKLRKAWIAASVLSIGAVSASALLVGTSESPIEALRGVLAQLPQLRSGLPDQVASDDRRQAPKDTDASREPEPEPPAETTSASGGAKEQFGWKSADAEPESVVSSDTQSEQDRNAVESDATAASGGEAAATDRTPDAAPAGVASRATGESGSATIAAEDAVSSPPQPLGARSRASAAPGRSTRETATRSQTSRSAPPTAAARPRVAPGTNVAQSRGRAAQSYASSRAAGVATFPYDPVAARSATAYLTMRATRLEPLVPGPQPEAHAAQVVANLTPTSTVGDARIVDPAAPIARESVASAPPSAPSPVASSTAVTDRPPASSAQNDGRSGGRGTSHRDSFRDGLSNVLKMLGIRVQPAVPIDERKVPSERLAGTQKSAADATRSAPVGEKKAEPARAQAEPRSMAPLAAPAQPSTPNLASPKDPVTVSALRSPDPRIEWAVQSPPSAAPAILAEARPITIAKADGDLRLRATRMLADVVPRVAAQARSDASQLLAMAAVVDHPLHQRRLIEAAQVSWRSEYAYPPSSADDARSRHFYHEAGRHAFSSGRTVDALDLELRAFAADPRDAEIAGLLAYLYLEVAPSQAETARQLALHALAFSGTRRSTRFEDWNTFAVASALAGRDADAARAFLVQLTLSGDAERTCRAALRAYSTFGERLRGPVDGLMQRIRSGPDPWACASSSAMLARSP